MRPSPTTSALVPCSSISKRCKIRHRQNIQSGQILRRWAISQTADVPAAPPDHAPKRRLCRRQNKLRIDAMNAEEDPEIIMSDLCADVEVDGHFLTVDIYKSDIILVGFWKSSMSSARLPSSMTRSWLMALHGSSLKRPCMKKASLHSSPKKKNASFSTDLRKAYQPYDI